MINDGRLAAQIAAERAASADEAALALYLAQLARAGRSIEQAAALIGRPVDAVREFACLWQVDFSASRWSPAPRPHARDGPA